LSDPAQAAFTDLQTAIAKERVARKANDIAGVAANDAMKALGEAVNYRERCKARLLELAEKPPTVVEATGVEHVRSLAAEPPVKWSGPVPIPEVAKPALPSNPRRKG
jgi:hypothetical protein